MSVRIITGDCREVLRSLPSESVSCIVTSPPYFRLRDYGSEGQIGLEETPDKYVAELVTVFREARRVLRSDGTFWLNLGDSYSSGNGTKTNGPQTNITSVNGVDVRMPRATTPSDALASLSRTFVGMPAAKQRLMIPARVALALQADGWWLRDEIIWHKPNPMPVSVTDRTTPAHEMVYMFSKQARYHYDMEAVKEPASGRSSGNGFARPQQIARGGRGRDEKWDGSDQRQPRSVWSIPTTPFRGAHFATFPPALIETCIKAGAPAGTVVLDPFGGAGTTGLVADRLGRDAILIEINEDYAAMARDRIRGDSPLFVAAE